MTASGFDPAQHPHRRFNPLTGEWLLVSPHRTQRPWQGQLEPGTDERRPAHDPGCYLCPGNARAGGVRNPDYRETFVFDNDYAALLADTPSGEHTHGELLRSRAEAGVCRVVCFSPRHDLTLAEMSDADIRRVVDVWHEQHCELGARESIRHVQIFENKGLAMGCSNPHPHGQIWAQQSIPSVAQTELSSMRAYYERHGSTLLADYLRVERERGERIVCENAAFTALVPYWAVWPFETMVLCRRRVASLADLHDEEKSLLAEILRRVTVRYDNLFESAFPYSAGLHQAPTDGGSYPEWDFHLHFYPPLLRSASVRKFMVGYEMLADAQRDITPEASAARLRELPERHYLHA